MKNKICHAYKVCGGCQYMGTAYPETLFEKRKYVQSLFPEHEVDMVIGMEDPYHYRNKVYATFGYDRNEKLIAGMLQISVWSGLRELEIGASLQHYNPVIDNTVREMFNVPEGWQLVAEMPFGGIAAEPAAKDKEDISKRVSIYR